MALQVKLVQKSGIVSLSSAVTTALQEGWQPYGSPYVTAAAAAQVMFLPDDATPASDAEYFLASKDGVVALGTIILERLANGWTMFGEPLETQYGPTQAMTKGKFKIFMPNLGFGDESSGSGGITEAEVQALIDTAIAGLELPEAEQWQAYVDKGDQDTLQSAGEQANNAVESLRVAMEHKDTVVLDSANIYTDEAIAKIPIKDWEGDFTRIEQNIEELYNVLNSMPDPTPALTKALDEAVASGKQELQDVSDKIDKKFEQQSNQIDQVWGYVDQKYGEATSALRGEVAGLTDMIEQLRQDIQMETSERRQDVVLLNARLDALSPLAS